MDAISRTIQRKIKKHRLFIGTFTNRGDKFLNSNYKNFVKAKAIEERKINVQKR